MVGSTPNVFCVRDWLKVRRQDACSIAAQVVELKTLRDWPVQVLPRDTVSGDDLATKAHAAIAVG